MREGWFEPKTLRNLNCDTMLGTTSLKSQKLKLLESGPTMSLQQFSNTLFQYIIKGKCSYNSKTQRFFIFYLKNGKITSHYSNKDWETNTHSNRVPSMLITSSKTSSQVASTTPTAFIALLQLFGCIGGENKNIIVPLIIQPKLQLNHAIQIKQKGLNDSIQENQLQEALQKCGALK